MRDKLTAERMAKAYYDGKCSKVYWDINHLAYKYGIALRDEWEKFCAMCSSWKYSPEEDKIYNIDEKGIAHEVKL